MTMMNPSLSKNDTQPHSANILAADPQNHSNNNFSLMELFFLAYVTLIGFWIALGAIANESRMLWFLLLIPVSFATELLFSRMRRRKSRS